MALETLVKTTFSEVFRNKEIWADLSAGKLLNPDFKKELKFGDEVDVIFDGTITLSKYTGGDLSASDAEKASSSTVKVKIDQGYSVIFKLDDAKIRQIENAKTNEEKVKLAKKYAEDTKKQFLKEVNKACCSQFVRAGIRITGANDAAIVVSTTNVHQIFAKAKADLVKGDEEGHTAWVDGEMIAVISPDMQAFMSTQNLLQYSDTMAKTYKSGYVGEFYGFHVIVDNDVAKDANGYEYPLFGREKKTIAGGVQDDFEIKSDTPVGGFDTVYWGKGVFGVKAPLAYLLATAKLSVNFSIGE